MQQINQLTFEDILLFIVHIIVAEHSVIIVMKQVDGEYIAYNKVITK